MQIFTFISRTIAIVFSIALVTYQNFFCCGFNASEGKSRLLIFPPNWLADKFVPSDCLASRLTMDQYKVVRNSIFSKKMP